MAYIGHSPTNAGTFYILDDITMGSGTTYGLAVGGVSVSPSADNLLITLDGVIQHPGDAYTVSGSNIVFESGPGSGVEFYGIIMGQSASTGQGSIGADELKVSGDGSSGQVLVSDGDGTFSWINQNTVTASTAATLATARAINGVNFDGSAAITVTAAAGTLSGNTLKSTVTASSLTSVGTLTSLTTSGDLLVSSSDPTITIKRSNSSSYAGHLDFTNNADALGWQVGTNQVAGDGFEVNYGASNKFYVTTGGKVGIGTASPSVPLDVVGTLKVGAASSGRYFNLLNDSANSYLDVSHGLVFRTNGASSLVTPMFLSTAGNVGIGTTSPSYPLDIEGSSNDGNPLLRATATNTPSGGFNWASEFISSNLANDKRFTHIWGKSRGTYGMAHLSYMPKSTSSESYLALGLWGANDILNVLGNGSVGIGTTSPAYALDIDNANNGIRVNRGNSTGAIATFRGQNTEKLLIDTDGIKFNGDTAAANALDDYEEGTFSAKLYSQSPSRYYWNNDNSANYYQPTTQSCSYVKVGKIITVMGHMTFTGTYDHSYDNIGITHLPFNTVNRSGQNFQGLVLWSKDALTSNDAVRAGTMGALGANTNHMSCGTTGTTSTSNYTGNFSLYMVSCTNATVSFSITYETN